MVQHPYTSLKTRVSKHCWKLKLKPPRLSPKPNNVNYPQIDRVQRLKDARQEALKEIEALKAQKQQEFLNYEALVVKINLAPRKQWFICQCRGSSN